MSLLQVKSPRDPTPTYIDGKIFDRDKFFENPENKIKAVPFPIIKNSTIVADLEDTVKLNNVLSEEIDKTKIPRKITNIPPQESKKPVKYDADILEGSPYRYKAAKPIHYNIPDFSEYSDLDRIRIRVEYDQKFASLDRVLIGTKINNIPPPTATLDEVHIVYEKWKNYANSQGSARRYKYIIAFMLTVFEWFATIKLGFNIGGISEYIWESISDYENILVEMGEVDIFSIGSGWSPAWRLASLIGLQMIIFMSIKYITGNNKYFEGFLYMMKNKYIDNKQGDNTDFNVKNFFSIFKTFTASGDNSSAASTAVTGESRDSKPKNTGPKYKE